MILAGGLPPSTSLCPPPPGSICRIIGFTSKQVLTLVNSPIRMGT